MPSVADILVRTAYPLFRRLDFPGKELLRGRLPLPAEGTYAARFPGGVVLELDARESLQRDYLFGLYEAPVLRLVRRLLRDGGDFVDVGAHVGLYAVTAAKALGARGRVLALEPHPGSRALLLRNLGRNGCRALVVPHAASEAPARAVLRAPAHGDAAWSRLDIGAFDEAEEIEVECTTVDREVARHDLRPVLVKIDVEGHEVRVVRGMAATLALRPAILCEVTDARSAAGLDELLGAAYRFFAVRRSRPEPIAPAQAAGLSTVLLLPRERAGAV